jgi:hypothetical protein
MDELEQLYDRDSEIYDAIKEVCQDAARKGLIVDSGRRRWSERTRRYEIVWTSLIYDPNKRQDLN